MQYVGILSNAPTSPTAFSVKIALTRLVLGSTSDSLSSANALQTFFLLPGRSKPGTGTPDSHGSWLRRSLALFRLQAAELYVLITLVKTSPPSTPSFDLTLSFDSSMDGVANAHLLPPTHLPIYPGDRWTRSYALCIYQSANLFAPLGNFG